MESSIMVDIDETLVDTSSRKRSAWKLVLGVEIPVEVIEENPSRKILNIYAPNRWDLWLEFWRTLLCYKEEGVELLSLDKAIAGAAEVLNRWAESYRIIYITGRTENMRVLTLRELEELGFPTRDGEILMSPSLEDFLNNPLEVRRKLIIRAAKASKIARVIDDYPKYFRIYSKLGIPDRIGVIRSRRYSESEYEGATKLIKEWRELLS
ncbi:MAG: hypothetical protein ACP5K1_06415 [Candidatus Bathyarchaeia archaeon]